MNVVCIGYDSQKVIEHVVVRRIDDPCSQLQLINTWYRMDDAQCNSARS